jgi:hypothetical protein
MTMRAIMWLAASSCALALGAGVAAAQQSSDRIAIEQPGIGRLETHIQRYGGALGVVSRLVRPRGAEVECNAVCYYPSSSNKAVAWRCAPQKPCVLHCLVNPPAGGCD